MKAIKIATMLIVAGAVTVTYAEVININFIGAGWNTAIEDSLLDGVVDAGPAVSGEHWNDFDVWAPAPIVKDDSGAALTGVELSASSYAGTYGYVATLPALKGYAYSNPGGTLDWSITGLADGSQWDVYIIAHGDSAGQGSDWTIGAETLTTTAPLQDPLGWVEGESYVKFSNVTAAGGSIAAHGASTGSHMAINGIQFVAVPEPGTFGLFSVLGGGIVFVRRRLSR